MIANMAMRVVLFCFLSAPLLTGCAREKPSNGYWSDLAKGVKDVSK